MNVPDVPQFPEFSSDRVLHFFKLWELIKYENLNPTQVYDNIENKYVLDPENEFQCQLLAMLMEVDQEHRKLLFSEKDLVKEFFTTIIDQPAFQTKDHKRLRNMLIDWYSCNRTLVSKSRKSIDPYSLSDDELNDLILGFGFPYPYDIRDNQKSIFLHELIGYYKHKGTPKTLGDVLTFYGVVDCVICEWWLKHDFNNGQLWMESKPVWPRTEKNNQDYVNRVLYSSFVRTDPFWHYDKNNSEEQLLDIYNQTEDGSTELFNKITLPSITPYISLNSSIKTNQIFPQLSILNRKVQEMYEWWMKYVLKWKGSYTSISEFPSNPQKNWIVYLESSSSHHVYNGRNWIDLGVILPRYLVEAEPVCMGEEDFYLPTDVSLNIYESSSFSLLETMIALTYILSFHFGLYANRKSAVASFGDLPEIAVEENELRFVNDTTSDAIYFNQSWHDLQTTFSDYDATSSNLTLITHIPNDTTSIYLTRAHLEYDGRYSPLDYIYDDQTSLGYTTYCRDNIDDVDYSDIIDEWNELHVRPKDTPLSNVEVGLYGEEQRPFYTAKQKREEQLSQISDSFYRKIDNINNTFELINNFTRIGESGVLTRGAGWWWDSTNENVDIILLPETRGFGFSSDSSSVICRAFLSSSQLSEAEVIYQSFSGTFRVSFDCEIIENDNSNLLVYASSGFIPSGDEQMLRIEQSGHYTFDTTTLINIDNLLFSNETGDKLTGIISNVSFKIVVDNSEAEIYNIDTFFSGNELFSYDSTSDIPPGWIITPSVSSDVLLELNPSTREMIISSWDETSETPQFGFIEYYPNGATYDVDLARRIPNDSTLSEDHWVALSFEMYDYTGKDQLAVFVGVQESDLVSVSNLLYANDEAIFRVIFNLKNVTRIFFSGQVLGYYGNGRGYYKIRNVKIDEIDPPGGVKPTLSHFTAYSNSKKFLSAMCPDLLDAIDSSFYISGLLYPDNLKKMYEIQEIFMQDLSFYFKNVLNLPRLSALSNYILGLVLYDEIKKVINFLKPFRVRFRTLMTDLEIDDGGVADGMYVDDQFNIPQIIEKLIDINTTEEEIKTLIKMTFYEMYYKYEATNKSGVFIGGPGVNSAVFDGINRSLFEEFKETVKFYFTDYIRTTLSDAFIANSNEILHDDVGPYNYERIRANDTIENCSVNTVFIDDYSSTIYELNKEDSGLLEIIDSTTNIVFNKISFETSPSEYKIIDTLTPGIIITGDTTSILTSGFYEIDENGVITLLGSDWTSVSENKIESSPTATNFLMCLLSNAYYYNDDPSIFYFTPGIPIGYMILSYNIDVYDGVDTVVTLGEKGGEGDDGLYNGNPNFYLLNNLSSGANELSNYSITEESYTGCTYVLIGDGSGNPFHMAVNSFSFSSLSWTSEPNLREITE